MRNKIFYLLIVVTIFIIGCTRDMSKQIGYEKATEIAIEKIYGDKGKNNSKSIWISTTEEINGDYSVLLRNLDNKKCSYYIDILYDGSRIKRIEKACFP